MDLEGFELFELNDHLQSDTPETGLLSISDALKQISIEWHIASRRARWMDLLGDYAGTEPFIIDGHSLIQMVIDDPLLALGKSNDPSFQLLHAFHSLERILGEFVKRSAVFDVVFWEGSRHLAMRTGVGDFEGASRSLARKLLFNHLRKIPEVSVCVFAGLSDPKWKEYLFLKKPMFALVNDGNMGLKDSFADRRLLCHRIFLCDLLTRGMALALLAGAEFRHSKILSFVIESRPSRDGLLNSDPVRATYSTAVRALEEKSENTSLIPSFPDPFSTAKTPATEDVVLEVASQTGFSSNRDKALLYAFLIHLILLPHLSTQHRARRAESMKAKFKQLLVSEFLPNIFRVIEASITSLNTTIDVDVRLFIALVRFLAENRTLSVQNIFGDEVAEVVQNKLSSFSVPVASFGQFASEFLPTQTLAPPPTLGLLPFSNQVFDDELAPIRGDGVGSKLLSENEEEEEEEEGSNSDEWDTGSEEEGKEEGSNSDEWDTGSEDEEEGSNSDEWDTGDEEQREEHKKGADKSSPEVPTTGYFDDGKLYQDTRHWHNSKKPILPKHLGGEAPPSRADRQWQRKLRSDQRFMKTLHDQAATLTGASGATLHQIKIPSVATSSASARQPAKKQSHTRTTSSKAPQKQSKADAIREQNLAQKAQKQLAESITWMTERIRDLNSQQSMSSLEKMLLDFKRSPRFSEPSVAAELALYHLHRVFQSWILDPERESAAVRDRHSVTAIRTVRDILELNYSTNEMRKCVQDVLNVLGLSAYTDVLTVSLTRPEDRPLTFKFVKLVKSKTQEPLHVFMRIQEHPIEWQLRVFGEFMDRSMDSQSDPRVSFKPDAWQRKVLDAIDKDKSLLVVAPTSAGKTFISYYAMEKVLRGSDEGVIIYVAPTKALVTQVAAEVYARFSKDLRGRSCWSIHTRDYRIHDPQNCQILVTVPEMLAIMFLSPPLAKVWAPRVKYIILDEIHSIGQQEGGSVWEQILLLAPCPVIGLSATVGEPEKFNAWLEAVQKANGLQYTFVHHPHRYSHLRKFFYNIHEKPRSMFESIPTYRSTGRMRYLHPISMLAFGPRSIPSDLALEASDTLMLYQALAAHGNVPSSTLEELNPLNFFPSDKLLQQKDVIAYDNALKACLAPMVAQFDPRDVEAPLYKVIASLEDDRLNRVATKVINTPPSPEKFMENLIHLVCDLHAQGDLPAIFFSFDRSNCEIMAQALCETLVDQEEKWRDTSPEWQHKLAQYEDWLSRAKERERAAARAVKNKADPDGDRVETTEWQATFDPDAPLPQFSFVGQRSSYTQSMLDEELADMAKWTRTPEWALLCLRRGVAVHHAGMNKRYRAIVESLFRQGFIRVIFATGTLALGINAPTKTSVFCGDSPFLTALMYRQCAGRAGRRGYDLLGKVVFFGLPMDRVQRLTLSKLPSLGANFPVTSTLVLRLFNLLYNSEHAPIAVDSVKRLFRLPQIGFGSKEGTQQLLHHLRFSIDYLRRARLLDELGRPFNLFGIASNLYYTEPSNFALVTLLRHGVLHRICRQSSMIRAKNDFVLLMSHLFGRRYLPASYMKGGAEAIKKSASIVALPPLQKDARQVLEKHEEDVIRNFTGYALTYSSDHSSELGSDILLPLSGIEFGGTPTLSADARFAAWLGETTLKVVARSLFVANSGHDDHFESVTDLTQTARRGLNLSGHAIPSFAHILDGPTRAGSNKDTRKHAVNAYIFDFFTHGQVQVLSDANAIRRGDVWYLLQEFMLTLLTVQGVLERLIMRKPEHTRESDKDSDDEGDTEDVDSGFVDVDDPTERDDEGEDGDNGRKGSQTASGAALTKPKWVADRDWRVLEVVRAVTVEFDEKFKAMWA